jgi:hypothetical protein
MNYFPVARFIFISPLHDFCLSFEKTRQKRLHLVVISKCVQFVHVDCGMPSYFDNRFRCKYWNIEILFQPCSVPVFLTSLSYTGYLVANSLHYRSVWFNIFVQRCSRKARLCRQSSGERYCILHKSCCFRCSRFARAVQLLLYIGI